MKKSRSSKKLPRKKLDIRFYILASFLITFILSRIIVYFFVFGPPKMYLKINGIHIHHLTFGIAILAIIGYVALTTHSNHFKKFMAVLYGIGLALAFDEFGMWLHLKDDYWIRHSYDAVLIITLLLFNSAFLRRFWIELGKHLTKLKKYKRKIFYLFLIKLALSAVIFSIMKLGI
ncbi:MAG: hypothetical protein M1450_02125 [Patescibacteria group bacterium]|nr:hypothetical protein [Patescibacteria group bacterium]